MKQIILAVAIASSVVGCGGGSSGTAPDNSAAINSALTNIAQTLPAASKPFLGAFASVDGVSIGYVAGTSEDDVAKQIANAVASNADKYPAQYKDMLSDLGMAIVVFGNDTGQVSSINGVPLKYPDVAYVAKIGKGGVVEVWRV